MFALALALASGAACKKPDGGPPTKVAPELVGYWNRAGGGDADFVQLELKADGSYWLDTGIVCVTEPCPSDGEGKWLASDFGKSKSGKLKLTGTIEQVYDATLTTSPKKSLRIVRKDSRDDYDATFEAGERPR